MTWEELALSDCQQLQTLVAKYGAREVWEAGLEVLGFPPAWQPSLNDAAKIQQHLEAVRGE